MVRFIIYSGASAFDQKVTASFSVGDGATSAIIERYIKNQ